MKNEYIHRDISWLAFNERVLQEAANPNSPVYERLKFLAIFSSNLDEFYSVRMPALREFKKIQKDTNYKFTEQPKTVIKQIQATIEEQQKQFGSIFRNELMPILESENVFIVDESDFTEQQKQFAKNYFIDKVADELSVININDSKEFSFLENDNMFLSLDSDGLYLISIPSTLYRFIELPTDNDHHFYVTTVDEIIRSQLGQVDPKFANKATYAVKITKDAELYFDEYKGDLVQLLKENIEKRKFGVPTRMLYDSTMPKDFLKNLRTSLELNKTDLMPGGRYHNFSDFFGFPLPASKTKLKADDIEILNHPKLSSVTSIIDHVQTNDELLSYPYQSFSVIPKMILEAAGRKDVQKVSITLYRVSKGSQIAKALLECLKNGKEVTVFIEAKARFDEANNLYWGEILEKNGANVLYSMPNIKVHSKILLIEGDDFKIAQIGTGNFNEKSAKIYTDFALLTADKQITNDLVEVFSFLTNPEMKPNTHSILMSPFTTRNELNSKIDREINHVKNGNKGQIIFKMNSLEDEQMIDKLIEAADAGVNIQLIVRGIYRLKTNHPNINSRSIVGQFLEHPRIYSFNNNGDEEIYIASADLMLRNLDKRVEVGVKVTDPQLKETLKTCLNYQLADNTKARVLENTLSNEFVKNNQESVNSQIKFYNYLKNKSTTK